MSRGRVQLEEFEGRRHEAYQCTMGVWTIGIGHTGPEVHSGLTWTDDQIDDAFDADITEAEADLDRHFPWWRAMNEPRQWVLIGMCFQLGITKLRKFVNTLGSMELGQYGFAAVGMENSAWARQTPKRVKRLAQQMRTGDWA
jgi:lysozyme